MEVAVERIKKMILDVSRVQVKSREWLFQGKWLKSGLIRYSMDGGQERVWETTERTTRTERIDGVDIIALSEKCQTIHLVAVYRPSVNCVSLEIPGGLVDRGESIEQACLRELGEETGQSGSIESQDFTNHCDPWKSNESSVACVVKTCVDRKCDPSLKPDEDECIETFELPVKDLLMRLSDLKTTFGDKVVIESKLYMLAKGIQLGQTLLNDK